MRRLVFTVKQWQWTCSLAFRSLHAKGEKRGHTKLVSSNPRLQLPFNSSPCRTSISKTNLWFRSPRAPRWSSAPRASNPSPSRARPPWCQQGHRWPPLLAFPRGRSFFEIGIFRTVFLQMHYSLASSSSTKPLVGTLGQKSSNYPKIHIFNVSFLTKFTFSKFHFSQNSHFSNTKFWIKSWVLPQCGQVRVIYLVFISVNCDNFTNCGQQSVSVASMLCNISDSQKQEEDYVSNIKCVCASVVNCDAISYPFKHREMRIGIYPFKSDVLTSFPT